MNQWKNIAAVVALSLTTALAGTGCLAQSDDPQIDDPAMVDDQSDAVTDADENTGEAEQAWWGRCFCFPRFLPFFGFFPCHC